MDLRTIVQHLRDNHIHLEGKVTWLRVAKAGSDWMRVIWGAVPSHEATEEAPFIELHYLHTTHNSIWSVGSGLHSVAREHVESSLWTSANTVSLVYSTFLPCTLTARSSFPSSCLQSKVGLQSPGFMVSTGLSQALEVISTEFCDGIFF